MLFKGLFSKNKNSKTIEIGGDIKYYKLNDWWLNSLSEEERSVIKDTFKPMSTSLEEYFIDKRDVQYTTNVKSKFLGTLATWFLKPEYYEMAKKILIEGEKYIDNEKDILNIHFFYGSNMKVHYRNRDNDEDALNKAIYYCEKQISMSREAKEAFLKEYPTLPIPAHAGYKQLTIIYEKNKEYDKALELSKQALAERWNDDWENRIARLEKKISKS